MQEPQDSKAGVETVPRRSTIRDVARSAGVGIGTISRVLNSSSQVSPETRARVKEAIRRLGFRPNAQARRILKRRSEIVCFLLSNRDFLHPFHAHKRKQTISDRRLRIRRAWAFGRNPRR